MKTVYITMVIAALAAFSASPAFADGATYVTHPPHAYGPSADKYGASHNKYTAGNDYGPSKNKYLTTDPHQTGSPTQAVAKQASMETVIPY